jgi:hypothetical protein
MHLALSHPTIFRVSTCCAIGASNSDHDREEHVETWTFARAGGSAPLVIVGRPDDRAASRTRGVEAQTLTATLGTARNTMSKKEKAKIKGTVDPSIAATLDGQGATAAIPRFTGCSARRSSRGRRRGRRRRR